MVQERGKKRGYVFCQVIFLNGVFPCCSAQIILQFELNFSNSLFQEAFFLGNKSISSLLSKTPSSNEDRKPKDKILL